MVFGKLELWNTEEKLIFPVVEINISHYINSVVLQNTDQLLLALLWQPFGVVVMKMHDGGVRTSRVFTRQQLFIVLQQSQAEGERLPLTMQHV